MGNLPSEVLVNILSLIPFHDKHVVKRVNSRWEEAADVVIERQKRLVVYRDDLLEHKTSGKCLCITFNPDDHISVFYSREQRVRHQRETSSGCHPKEPCVCLLSHRASGFEAWISQR